MNEESILSKAESLRSELDTLRVLIDAVDSKISFFVREKSIFGHCYALINAYAVDIQTLLAVVNERIYDMEKEQDQLIKMVNKNANR